MRPISGFSDCAARLRMHDALAPLLVASRGSGPPGSPNLSPKVFGRASRTPDRLFVLGRGNLGQSLDRAFRAAGQPTSAVPGRTGFIKPPLLGIVFLAVPDQAVEEVAAKLARLKPSPRLSFVHTSGALGLGILDPLRGHPVGSFHPLQSFPSPRDPSAFRGITVAVDASTPALMRRLRSLARAVGAKPRRVGDEDRAVYHAAAVYASNYVDAVVAEAVRLLGELGWSDRDATKALVPLVEGAVAGIRERGPVKALTGPIKRGDAETVRRHLEALDGLDRGAEYRMLGKIALEIAVEAGLEPAAAGRIHRALTEKTAATRRRRRK
jgi:predicted short-subunit dehydrogenase-like oxidoreductase (DUF2520 family)